MLNPFLVIQAGLSMGAAIFEAHRGNGVLAVVYLSWAVSNLMMSFLGGK